MDSDVSEAASEASSYVAMLLRLARHFVIVSNFAPSHSVLILSYILTSNEDRSKIWCARECEHKIKNKNKQDSPP